MVNKYVTRNVNTHKSKKSIVDVLREFEGQYVILKGNGLLYSQTICRCGTPHVDVFTTKSNADKETTLFPRKEMVVWELNEDFYRNYEGLKDQAVKLYNPLR